MKIVPANVNRTVVTRVIVAWAALSLLAGTVAFYVEWGRVNRMVLALATNETKLFTEHIDAVGPEHVGVLEKQAREFLKGDFISLRLYGVDKKRFWKPSNLTTRFRAADSWSTFTTWRPANSIITTCSGSMDGF